VLDVAQLLAIRIDHQLFRIRFQIAVRVLGEPQMRWLADQHAFVEHLEGARQDKAVHEHGLLVHLAVVVSVFQYADSSDRLALARCGQVSHVPPFLDDPHAAIRIPIDEDRLLDHGFAGHKLNVVAGRHVERIHLVSRR
jgi:hypothetical protein